MNWTEGPARIVEHDEATLEPKPGGQVIRAVIRGFATYVHVLREDGELDWFWAESGWRAMDARFRWRLTQDEEEAIPA